MKKLVFSLMVLFLASENIARGSFFQLGLAYDHFYTYDLLNIGKEKLLQRLVPNTDFKINFNPQLLSINKKIKIYLDVSVGLTSHSFQATKNEIEEYKREVLGLNNVLYIDKEKNPICKDFTMVITSVEKSRTKKGKVSINGFLLDETKTAGYKLKDIKIENENVRDLLIDFSFCNKITVLPLWLTYTYVPCSIGISTKIKTHKKTFIKIKLRGYMGFHFFNYYETILTDLYYHGIIIDDSPRIIANNIFKSYSDSNIIEFVCKNFPSSFKKPTLYLILLLSNSKVLFAKKYFYGGIFNITISSKIYKHIEINISLFSLEFCYVKDPIVGKLKHKQTGPFNGNNSHLFLHLPSFGISLF